MDVLDLFGRSVEQSRRALAAVRPEQLGEPTPCEGWTVKDLSNHLVAVMEMYAEAAGGAELDFARFGQDLIGDDPAGAGERAAAASRQAWSDPAVLEREVHMPFGKVSGREAASFGIVETLAHTWDLTRATRQDAAFDNEVSEAALTVARQLPPEVARHPRVFGPETPCGDDAPLHDRLAAFVGRKLVL